MERAALAAVVERALELREAMEDRLAFAIATRIGELFGGKRKRG